MGVSTDAVLAYGYDLGGSEEGWNVHEVGDYDNLTTSWHDDGAEDADFAEAVQDRLLEAAGFTETDWRAEGYWARKQETLALCGVHIVAHCSDSCSSYILAACSMRANRGWVEPVNLEELPAMQGVFDARLSSALKVLGLTPVQEVPAWLLASYWGQ